MRGLTPSELLAWKPPFQEYIIQDILLTQGTLGIYGAEGVWKSMLALDLMFRVSSGLDWFGFRTYSSSMFYYQTEVPQAPLQKRTLKYMLGNKNSSNNCWLCTELYSKIDKGYGAAELEKEIDRTRPKGLLIDPLNTSVGANLNDDYESGLAIDRLNMWRDKYKLAIIIIHHSRKSEHKEGQAFHYGSDEFGGSGRWKKWLDSLIYVELVNDADPLVDLRLTFEKNPRHAETKILPIDIQTNRLDLTIKRRGSWRYHMNEQDIKNIINDIMDGEYWKFEPGTSTVLLDGNFTIDQLTFLTLYMSLSTIEHLKTHRS